MRSGEEVEWLRYKGFLKEVDGITKFKRVDIFWISVYDGKNLLREVKARGVLG